MEPILLVIAALALAMAIGFLIRKAGGGRDPENPVDPDVERRSATGTEDPSRPPIERYPPGSRPADPGAEAMNPADAGDPTPSDDTGQYGTDDAAKPSDASRKPLDEDR
jgi:hypothetical protein